MTFKEFLEKHPHLFDDSFEFHVGGKVFAVARFGKIEFDSGFVANVVDVFGTHKVEYTFGTVHSEFFFEYTIVVSFDETFEHVDHLFDMFELFSGDEFAD